MSTSAVTNLRRGLHAPAGRPTAARARFNNEFVADLAADWAEHGPNTITKVRMRDPVAYLRVAAALVPKDVQHSIEHRILPGGLSAEDWAAITDLLDLIKANVPAGLNAVPAEVFAVMASALRAHYAKPIEGSVLWNNRT